MDTPRRGGAAAAPSTFESRPSKSAADFPASEPSGVGSSATTSELEAKLRQRMLKCEGRDIQPSAQAASPRQRSPGRQPSRLKPSILKPSCEAKATSRSDELLRTAAYQRCTKHRAQSAHGLREGGAEIQGRNSHRHICMFR